MTHSQGTLGSWSIFNCRPLVSIQLPPTLLEPPRPLHPPTTTTTTDTTAA
ncbi:hypothetical protein [Mycobacterium sp.]